MSMKLPRKRNQRVNHAIWESKGYFEKEKIILHEKNLKHRKLILFFTQLFLLIVSYQILKNYPILINHESFFQRKDFSQLHRFLLLKIYSLMLKPFKKNFINKFLNLIIIDSFSKIGNG